MIKFKDVPKESFDASGFNILVVTATPVETKAFLDLMQEEIVKIVSGLYTYYLGRVGQYEVVLVQCLDMGSLSPGGSSITVNIALAQWPQIKAAIMVGICFGVDEEEQQIGDVIVSTIITNYETRRVGDEGETPRGGSYHSDWCLLNAFKSLKYSWENIGIDDQKKDLSFGEYLSGEILVDFLPLRKQLLEIAPEAKAGEMEGNGLVGACDTRRIPWILVKAICDFGDGTKKNDKLKKWKQQIAAASSARCCEAALEQLTAFEHLHIYSVNKGHSSEDSLPPVPVKAECIDVLFDIYKKEYSPYFLSREIDKVVESYLLGHSLWIYGASGVGKSTSILHSLLSRGRDTLLINLASVPIDSTGKEIFEWIYNEVANSVGDTTQAPADYQSCIRRIIKLLDDHYSGRSVYVLVEEIPFSDKHFSNFVQLFSSLIISDKLTGTKADVHFVLSSVENPMPHIPRNMLKIKSMMGFLQFELWSEQECNALIDLIEKYIAVPVISNRVDFIAQCDNLPRWIKTVFRYVSQPDFSGVLDPGTTSKIISLYK